MKIKDTTYEQLHEGERSQRNGGLNHTISNVMYQEDLYTSQSYLYFESGTHTSTSRSSLRLIERVVAQLALAQASSADNEYTVFDYRAIRSNLLEVNDLPAQERDSAACHRQRFGGVATTTSQVQLISILDDALCIIDETFEELLHQ